MRPSLTTAILFSTAINAQTTFAPIGATWTYTQHHQSPDSGLFSLVCTGDTVIQGRACIHLEDLGDAGCMPWHRDIAMQGDSVLVHDLVDDTFRTLYVFGLPIGGTWQTVVGYESDYDTIMHTVVDTGSMELNGVLLRTMEVTTTSEWTTWSFTSGRIIERLGDLSYLFPWIYGTCDMEMNAPLRCYSDPDISWLNPELPQCDLSTSVTEPDMDRELMVSPTVIDQGGTIRITSDTPVSVELLDATGRVIRAARTNTTLTIEKPGIYFVRAGGGALRIGTHRVLVR